jgi:hypothetical protein
VKLKYTVHTVSREYTKRTATVDGRDMEVNVPSLVIELVSSCGGMAHTFQVIPDDIAAAEAECTPGTECELSLKFGTPAPVVVPDHSAEFAVHEKIAEAIAKGRKPPPMPGMESDKSGGDE